MGFNDRVLPVVRLGIALIAMLAIGYAWFFVYLSPLLYLDFDSDRDRILAVGWLTLPLWAYQICDKVMLKGQVLEFSTAEVRSRFPAPSRELFCWRFVSLMMLILSAVAFVADSLPLKYGHLIAQAEENAYYYHELDKPHENYLERYPDEGVKYEERLKYLKSLDAYNDANLSSYERNVVKPHRWVIYMQTSDYQLISLLLLALVSWCFGVKEVFLWIWGKKDEDW